MLYGLFQYIQNNTTNCVITLFYGEFDMKWPAKRTFSGPTRWVLKKLKRLRNV